MPVWLYQYVFSHLHQRRPAHNHAAKVRELVDFLYLMPVYSDLAAPFTSSAHPFGLFCIDLKSNFTRIIV